jgi:hypothetical protein
MAASHCGVIDYIVVQQGGRVDELDDRRGFGVPQILRSTGSRRDQDHQWTKALAAAADDIFGNLIDQDDVTGQAVADNAIDFLQVSRDQLFDGLEAHVQQGKIESANGSRIQSVAGEDVALRRGDSIEAGRWRINGGPFRSAVKASWSKLLAELGAFFAFNARDLLPAGVPLRTLRDLFSPGFSPGRWSSSDHVCRNRHGW